MAKPKKDSNQISVRLRKDLYDKLNDHCMDSGQSKTAAIEKGLELLFERDQQIKDLLKQAEKV